MGRWCVGYLCVASIALAIAIGPSPVAGAEVVASELHFGSVAMDIPAVMHERLTPLTHYLSDVLGRPVTLKLSPDMPSAIAAVSSNAVQIAYLTPVAYLRANENSGARLVAKTVTNGAASFQLMIVVREDSPIQTVADLEGKHFAFGDRAALLQRAVVVGAGIELAQLGSYDFIGHYDNIVRGVMNRDFDAGIIKDTMALKWEGEGVRILHASAQLPPYNICVSAEVSDVLLAQIQQAFIGLNPENPEHLRVIKALDPNYDGFAPTSDEEYHVVRRLIVPFKADR